MRIALICERLENWPESLGVSPVSLARAFASLGHETHIVCDCTQRDDLLADVPSITLHSMRGERWRIVRRPRQFRPWALGLLPSLSPDLTISITPCIEATLWSPGIDWGWPGIRDEIHRFGLYSGIKRASQWHYPRWRTAQAAAKSLRSTPDRSIILAPDPEHAAALSTLLNHPREKMTLIGHASGVVPLTTTARADLAARVKQSLRIPTDALILLLAAERSAGPAVARLWAAVQAAAKQSPRPLALLLTGSKQAHALSLAPNPTSQIRAHLIPAGRTERLDALLAAADFGLLPHEPSSPRDPAFIADCLRSTIPVIADRAARSAAALAREFPDAIHTVRTPTIDDWTQSILHTISNLSETTAAAAKASESLDINRFAARLLEISPRGAAPASAGPQPNQGPISRIPSEPSR